MGAKQAFVNSCQNHIVKLRSPSKPGEDSLKKKGEENDKRHKSSNLLSPNVPRKDTSNSPDVLLGSHQSAHIPCSTSVVPLRTLSKGKPVGESRKSNSFTPKPASKPNSGSLSCRTLKRNKAAHPRRRPVIPNDVDELFTPDPMTYVVSPTHKMAKPKIDGGTIKTAISEKNCSSSTVTSSCTAVTGSSCHKTQNSTLTGPFHAVDTKISSSERNPQIFLPTVALVRVKPALKDIERSKDGDLRNSPITSSDKQLKEKGVKSDEKQLSLLNSVSSHASETDTGASKQTLTSSCSQSPPLERQASEEGSKQVNEEDPIDVELGLSFALDLDLTQSSHSSEEEQLLSLQEMMERVTKPPDTPEKGAFSEPSTPGHRSCQLKIVSFTWVFFVVHKVINVC